ncbi:MAG: hypothetical protein ACPGKS_05460 [Coraliomargarita sp.]
MDIVHKLILLILWMTVPFCLKAELPTLDQLLSMSAKELEKVDIAVINLRCAEGLPGSETIHYGKVLREFDQLAEYVRNTTIANMRIFYQDPSGYDNNEALFKMSMMQSLLKRQCGIVYSPYRSNDEPGETFFADSKDIFITGFTNRQERMGTCASLPVLYTAIGRRMGYPLELVQGRKHLFFRWDGQGERFNCEVTIDRMSTPPDEHYSTDTYDPLTEEDLASGVYLRNITNIEALAQFMSLRSVCFFVNGKREEAYECAKHAHRLMPEDPSIARSMEEIERIMN